MAVLTYTSFTVHTDTDTDTDTDTGTDMRTDTDMRRSIDGKGERRERVSNQMERHA